MARIMTKTVFTVGLLVVLMSAPAFAGTVNKSIKIAAGAESDGASSVNGSITVGDEAIVSGDVGTVNGSIRVGSGARIEEASTVNGGVSIADGVQCEDLSTVNGAIKVGESVTVDGEIDAVNGRITVATASTVSKGVENVNGLIELTGAEIGGDVATVKGDISVLEGTVIMGDLIIEKPSGWRWKSNKKRNPRIIIGPGSRVVGTIVVEHEVDLFISDTAEVGAVKGVMTLDQAVRFSGKRP